MRLQHAVRCRPFARRVSGRQLVVCVGAAAPLATLVRGDGGQLLGRRGGAQPPPQLAHAPHPPHPMALLTPRVACSVQAGATMCVAERADGAGATARVPAVAAAAIAAAAALVGARRPCSGGSTGCRVRYAGPSFGPALSGVCGCERGRLREAPGRPPPGWAGPGGHPRSCWRRMGPWACVCAICVSLRMSVTTVTSYFGRNRAVVGAGGHILGNSPVKMCFTNIFQHGCTPNGPARRYFCQP